MNYLILIIVVVVIGYAVFAMRKKENTIISSEERVGACSHNVRTQKFQASLIFGQMKRKQENKAKILEFLKDNEKVTNNDVERICKVSHATAERYLNQLEKDGKLTQHGKIGQNVFYTLK